MKQSVEYKPGNVLSYAEYGNPEGFPILIQHGMVASITDEHLFDALSDLGTRLICIARPGYGESSPYRMKNMAEYGDVVSALVEKLAISQFDVLGMSSGAPYSYALGYKLAPKVRNIFIFSGTPALYNQDVVSLWPYAITPGATIGELTKVAREVFFSNLSKEDLQRDDIIDSMQHYCFGVAQDLKLRCNDWGFTLTEVPGKVYMQHCKEDNNVPFRTAEITASLLPNCQFTSVEKGGHFSPEALRDFIHNVMAKHY
jgi:pimeloyl-ACP methyl ester carboxylesterase